MHFEILEAKQEQIQIHKTLPLTQINYPAGAQIFVIRSVMLSFQFQKQQGASNFEPFIPVQRNYFHSFY
jgi:hypothetical protein